MLTHEEVCRFISDMHGLEIDTVTEIKYLKDKVGREIIDCSYQVGGNTEQCIVKVYHAGCDDDSELGVIRLAEKNRLASLELAAYSINIPKVHGSHLADDVSCIVMEKLEQTQWKPETRSEAAGILARLHNISFTSLSRQLRELVGDSKPNRDRGRLGVIGRSKFLDKNIPTWRKQYPELSKDAIRISESAEPVSTITTLVHGDYFTVNLIPTAHGFYVIDWDLLALGDPMWDLGMLIGADRGITDDEIEQTTQTYRSIRPVDEGVLSWQMKCWITLRKLIELMDKYRKI